MSEVKYQPNQTCTKVSKSQVSQRPKTSTGSYSLRSSLRKRDNGASGVISLPEKGYEKKRRGQDIEKSRDNLRKDDEDGTSRSSWIAKMADRKRKQRIEAVDKLNNDVSLVVF